MKRETIDKLCCPFDKADLQLTEVTKDLENNVLEGYFICSSCQRIYPIVKGIPIMSPDEYRDFQLEKPVLNYLTKKEVNEQFRLPGHSAAEPEN